MSAEFDAVVQPLRGGLVGVLDASRQLREAHGAMAMANSPAMAELATEHRYAGAWGQRPVESAHSWAGVLLAGGEDQLRTMCRVVVGEPSLFGPQSLARSGLEMSGRAYWLTEPGIDIERRIGRFETERLYNAHELRRLTGDSARPSEIEKGVTETANALGLPLLRGKRYQHTHVGEERPSGTKVFKTLLQDVEHHGLGHTMFSYLSAVDHGTIYGLIQAVGRNEPEETLRPTMRPLRMSAAHTNQPLGVATLGYGYAVARHADLLGWSDDEWRHVFIDAVRLVLEILQPPPP